MISPLLSLSKPNTFLSILVKHRRSAYPDSSFIAEYSRCCDDWGIWNIYENDIDRIIKKIARRDMDFAQRIDKCEPTLFDIEVIVRRASFQALKLKLVKTAYDIYLENG